MIKRLNNGNTHLGMYGMYFSMPQRRSTGTIKVDDSYRCTISE